MNWEDIIEKYKIDYKIDYKNNEYNIINDDNVKTFKSEHDKNDKDINQIKIVTFNVMATRFSPFVKKDVNGENNEEFQDRYNNIVKILCYFMSNEKVDIIFLQEVDSILFIILKHACKSLGYNNYYSNNIKKINKGVYGNAIIFNNSKYNMITMTIVKLTPNHYISQDDLYSLKQPRYSLLSYITNIRTKENIILSSLHLTGLQLRSDIRRDELLTMVTNMLSFEKKNLIICGDFNENNYETFSDVVKNNGLINHTHIYHNQTATSYHKFNINRETKEYYKEHSDIIYSNIDYIITSNNYKLINYRFYPLANNGIYGLEVPYSEGEKYDAKKWCSDHALIYACLEKI